MKLKTKINVLFFLIFSVITFSPLSADAREPLQGLKTSASKANLTENQSIQELAGNVVGVGLSLIGVVFFILVVYGGVLYMTSRGNEEQAARGRNTIITASIGVVLVLSSYALVSFVFSAIGASQSGGGGLGNTQNVNNQNSTIGSSCGVQDAGTCVDIGDCNFTMSECKKTQGTNSAGTPNKYCAPSDNPIADSCEGDNVVCCPSESLQN